MLLEWVADLLKLETGSRVRYAVLDIQGDWPAFLQIFGLRYWSHNLHPCPLCRINQDQLQEGNINDITLDSLPFSYYTTADYDNDVDRMVKVTWIEIVYLSPTKLTGYELTFLGLLLASLPRDPNNQLHVCWVHWSLVAAL